MGRCTLLSLLGLALTPFVRAGAQSVSQIQIVSETLPSGYRVVIAHTPPVQGRTPRIYVGSYVLRGSMQESRAGWAHLMEHVVANNRATIPGPPRPDTSIKYLEGNALTRPYYTSFVSVFPRPLLASAVHSRMARAGRENNDSAVFVNEVGRVLAELERDESGQFPAYKAVVALALGQSPKLADEIEIVRNTKRQDLKAAIDPIYRPENAVLVIAGDLDVDSTLALVKETEARLQLTDVRGSAPLKPTKPTIRMARSQIVDGQNRSPHNLIAIAWPKPALGNSDQIPALVANQLMLGRGESVEDPSRSQDSPIAVILERTLAGSDFWDGRASSWGAPDLVDTGPGVQALVFNTDSSLTPGQVRSNIKDAIHEIRSTSLSDSDIERAKESLASYYERWFFEPTYRVLADHLMAFAGTGREPNEVKNIPALIRAAKASDVRKAFDRYLLKVEPDIVILPKSN
jgi:predicted Zn-dependent peptidase